MRPTLVLLFVILFLSTSSLFFVGDAIAEQSASKRLTLVVQDPIGAVIPGAAVHVQHWKAPARTHMFLLSLSEPAGTYPAKSELDWCATQMRLRTKAGKSHWKFGAGTETLRCLLPHGGSCPR